MKATKIECDKCDTDYDGATDGDREHVIFCPLHAHAPELLNCLKHLLDICHDYLPHSAQENVVAYLWAAKQAVTKAEGK